MTDEQRGCDYCASHDNIYFEHVERVASNESTGSLLLRCPQCGWLYETDPAGAHAPRHLNEEQASTRFEY